jgi:hypothetical protein
MKIQQFCGPCFGYFDVSTFWGVNFEYDLHLGRTIGRWKGIKEEIYFLGSIIAFDYH